MKNTGKKIVSWLCVFAMVVACLATMPMQSNAADVEYNELTFRDWGFADEGEIAVSTNNSKTPVSSWDNVAISGSLKFHGDSYTDFEQNIVMFGGNEGNGKGLWIKHYAPDQVLYFGRDDLGWVAFGGITKDMEFDFRITFTPNAEDKLEVAITVGSTTRSKVVDRSAFGGTNIRMFANAKGYSYKSTPEPVIDYTELTFRDWGFGDGGTVTATKPSTKTPIDSWKNVAISGSITFGTDIGWDDIMVFGATEAKTGAGIWLRYHPDGVVYFGHDDQVIWYATMTGIAKGTEYDFRLAFKEKNSTTLTAELTIGGKKVSRDVPISRMGSTAITMIRKVGSYSYKSTPQVEYTELTFSDWGFKKETVTGNSLWSTMNPITTWDKVAINGSVSFPSNSSVSNGIIFGTTKSTGSWSGLLLWYHTGDKQIILSGNGFSMNPIIINGIEAGQKAMIRLTFEEVDDGLKVGLSVDGQKTVYATISKEAYASMGEDILVYAPETVTFKSIKDLTFRDWGFHKENFSGTVWSSANPIVSWDNTTVSGTVIFDAQQGWDDIISFGATKSTGSWAGVWLRYHTTDQCLYIQAEGINGKFNAVGGIKPGVEVDFLVRFTEEESGDLKVELVVGTKTASITIESTNISKLATDVLIVAEAKGLTVKSKNVEKNLADETYNIEDKAYVLTASSNITVNGSVASIGDVLSKAGDYAIQTTSNGVVSKRLASLYIIGDVNLSESTVASGDEVLLDAHDVAALKEILSGKEATPAQEKAADLNNDGKVDNTDLKLLQDIVSGKTARDAVIDKYFTDVLSFDFLGGDTVMPIAGFNGPDASHLTDSVFKTLKDSGINLINYYSIENYSNPNAILESLRLAEKYGIGMFVKDAGINYLTANSNKEITTSPNTQLLSDEEVAALRGDYSYYNSYLGNFVVDEPTIPYTGYSEYQISNTSDKNYQFYTKISQQLNKYTNSFGYLNNAAATWFGSSSVNGMSTGSINTYKNIIKTITESTDAKVLSFDRYMRDLNSISDCHRYMMNLDIIRSQALESEIPFWSYVQAGGNWSGSDSGTIPTEAEIYWEVNVNLAFGAKGIQYFPIVGLNSSNGMLDANYGTTSWYRYITNANKQITAVDEVLMKSDSIGVIATGGYAKSNTTNFTVSTKGDGSGYITSSGSTTSMTLDAMKSYSDIKSADGVQRVTGISGTNSRYGVLAGIFDYQGKVALYVVNWNTTANQDITVTFNKASNYRVITANGEVSGLADSYTATVAPGGAYLIVIEEEDVENTTQEFLNIDDIAMFKNENGTYEAPEVDGYVFAGWYTSDEISEDNKNNVIKDLSGHSGKLWAKYVDESVLTVKAQLANGTTATQTSTTKMRLVTTTNSLIYNDIGFKITTAKNPSGITTSSKKVFTKIIAVDGRLSFDYTPDVFDTHSRYFATVILVNLPVIGSDGVDYSSTEYTVTPFWTTPDGTRVYGKARTFSVAMGIAAAGETYSLR